MTKDRILSAAKAVLESAGFEGLTIRKVAQRAGLSPMALYRHFKNKDELLNALMQDGISAWEAIVGGIRARDPVKWLEALSEAYLDFALAQPHKFDAAFFLPAPAARRFPDDFAAGRSPAIALAMARIDQAKADGQFRDEPTLGIAVALAAYGQGFVSMHRAKRFGSDKQFKALYRAAQHQFLDSLKPSGKSK
ncbi:TetR/AcrR family transcriptional regulator [Rhodanobacter sp. DHG33]|uniref:TetR/AcrR family transcriptional regulator n=1 Tax=Rhodanobacter sp. DHG33 TaxID=2775921 RepID=UPI0017831C8D|nr:TetR/AcrR family transcriptional regulator [Rhodanobacter sp. DHG33]MBD8899056.1 TetR/AcrR family transcriptional regulator [Rhodanobacter sp. DHG33]